MRPLLLLLATLLATLTASAQIEQGDVSICEGESVTLSIAEPQGASNAFSNSNSLDFGSGDFVRIPIAPELTDFNEVTIEFWYYQISRGEEFIVATEYFNTGWGFHNENPNVLQWRVEGGPYSLGGSNFPIPYNEWMHVAGVYDGSELRLYANGTLVASEAYSGTISDSRNEDIVINRHVWASGSSSRLTGQLDELRISNVARYDGDFTPPSIAFEPDGNTLALYHFDEASGSMIQDASGNGHNGNISGTSWSSNLPFSSGTTTSTPAILWSTGETTSSINLTPASSQTVSVTVSESSNDFTDEVTVTVEDCTPATPDYVPTDGLVAWYPLDGDATDVGPNNIGHDYFSATATTNRFGEAGSALLFNGTTDWIQGDSELFPQNDRTIAFWAKFLQDGTELWMTGYGGGPIGYGTVIYANSNQCNVFNAIGHSEHGCQGTFQVPYSSIPDDQWVHIAMTSDPSTARFYINGVEQSSRAGLGEVITSGVHYYIGSSPSYNGVDNLSTGSFTGSMDDIGFWNRALTPAEILALATADAIFGCTDVSACNYDSDANLDDGSCAEPACDDPQACNYDASALCGGGNCNYCPELPESIPTDGLVAWYPLDGDATDVGPNNIGHDYFSATATTNRFGEAGSALLFNGTTDWIQGDSELFPQNDRTIAFWAKFLQDGTELWMTGYGGGPIGYGTVIYANSNQCNVFNAIGHSEHGCQGTFQVPYSSIPDDQWVHIAMTSDPSTARFYINGVEQSSRAGLGEVITSGVHYYIGSSPSYNGVDNLSTGSFTGSMDDIGFWNRALTPAEILALASLAPIPGCTDATACNYNSDATQDDGSCDLCGCLQPPTVVAGFSTNYLLASDGILTGWGTNNMDQTSIPADLPRIIKADAAEEYVIWLDEDQNVTIQGGNGPYSNSVPAGLQGIDVAAGRHHMVVVKTDGSLLSLGANYTGLQNEPGVNNAIQGAAGWYHNAAVLDDGSVVGWGDNWSAPANPISNAVAIDAGVDHTLVLKDDFTVEEWGNNINSSAAWGGLTNVVDIAAGGHGSLAIMSDGSMVAWSATDGSILFESDPGDFVLDADIDWGSLIVMYSDGSLETALTPPADALAFSDNWEGCGLCASDTDGDGICNDDDNACYANADLPVFSGISVDESASGPTTADATLTLDIAGGNPASLVLDAINGSGTMSFDIPAELSSIPPGYYTATVLNDDGCAAVASAPGGSTAGEEATSLPIIVSYALCCDCGVSDLDSDGICDDEDNCTDRSAPNYADPANVPCGCVDPVQYQGYSYDVVQVGDQCWFAENLRSENFRNGEAIENLSVNLDWYNALDSELSAVCENLNPFCESNTCGMLYNRFAVEDERGICPTGWTVPTDSDWMQLEATLGLPAEQLSNLGWRGSDQGTMLKSNFLWNGTNAAGFNAKPEGYRSDLGLYSNTEDAHYWCQNPGNDESWYRMVNTGEARIYRPTNANPASAGGGSLPRYGFSVRCVKN